MVEMARRAMATPAGAQRARVVLQIVAGHDTVAGLCELSNGTVISPAQIVAYLDAIDIRTIVFDSATHPVATSSRRTFTGALCAIIQVRDRHCQHPSSCDLPIDRCDIDHITPWACGGQTSQDNGRLLCQFHNRIQPQHTRPPVVADEQGNDEIETVEVNALVTWPPPDDDRIYVYHLIYAELLEHGP